jgi:intracellular multiplication protein IcmE
VSRAAVLRAEGDTAAAAKAAGCSALACKEAGFTLTELIKGPSASGSSGNTPTAAAKKSSGGSSSNGKFSSPKKPPQPPLLSPSSASSSSSSSTSLSTPLVYFTPSELNGAGYSCQELKDEAGFNARGCAEAGCTAAELVEVGYNIGDVQHAFYGGRSALELKRSGAATAAELADAGFSANELKAAGFSITELKGAGFSAAYLGPFFGKRLTRYNARGVQGQEVG